ncbi:Clp protease N-terminal domain-containing protein [Pseudonocardia sp. GCM10023141]|uniref:Clp protease N-terminal domain-containing protein n=1 Tax=Pseudonocardia sp. GCM10023141 TaxID=3252653 RepID=UPI003606B440
MFERFTEAARHVVVAAQDEARERGTSAVRSEHLLVALFRVPENLALAALSAAGVTRAAVLAEIDRVRGAAPRPSDADALATLGIDLDEVRRHVEINFGPGALDRTRAALGPAPRSKGHVPVDRTAKKVLELSLREAVLLKHRSIGSEHLLLGLLHPAAGASQVVLVELGMGLDQTRHVVEELVRGRQAG